MFKDNLRTTLQTLCFLCFTGAALAFGAAAAGESAPVSPDVRQALLAQDWGEVAQLCGPSEGLGSSPVLRALKAHACLALNRNDDSLALFLSLKSDADRTAWKEWTSGFAAANPSNTVALYLKGDALARLKEWDKAVAAYSESLAVRRDFALALNARGVAYACMKEFDKALKDIEQACAAAPAFADAYASMGVLLVLKEAPEGALENYSKALQQSPAFGLAKNGSGCAKIGYSKDPKNVAGALKDFAAAFESSATRELAKANIDIVINTVMAPLEEAPTTSEGMKLNVTVRDFLHRDPVILRDQMARMPTDDLKKAIVATDRNARHSEFWDPMLSVSKFGPVDLTPLSESARNDAKSWRNVQGLLHQELTRRNRDIDVGGARTKELEKGYADQGNWPVKTWFGLAQEADVPAVPVAVVAGTPAAPAVPAKEEGRK